MAMQNSRWHELDALEPCLYLISAEKIEFKADINTLKNACKHLEVILDDSTKTTKHIDVATKRPILKIKLKSPNCAIKYLLTHIRQQPLPITFDIIDDIASIANELNCTQLIYKCKKFLHKNFHENILKSIKISKKLNFFKIINQLLDLLQIKLNDYLQHSYKNDLKRLFLKIDFEDLKFLLTDGRAPIAKTESQLSLFVFLYEWQLYDYHNRESCISELFQLVDYTAIDLVSLKEMLKHFSYLFESYAEMKDLIFGAMRMHALNSVSGDDTLDLSIYHDTMGDDESMDTCSIKSFTQSIENREFKLKQFSVFYILIATDHLKTTTSLDDKEINGDITRALLSLPEYRRKTVCVHCCDFVRIIGGILRTKAKSNEYIYPDHDWEFNLKTQELQKIDRIPMGRIYFGVCAMSTDYLFVAGGISSRNTMNNTIDCCELRNRNPKWKTLSTLQIGCMAPAIEMHNDKIFIVGGMVYADESKTRFQTISKVYTFDVENRKLEKRKSLKVPRGNGFLRSYNNTLYHIGGLTASSHNQIKSLDDVKIIKSIEKYSDNDDTWTCVFEVAEINEKSSFIFLSNTTCNIILLGLLS